jgi:hypothetical protein
MSDRVVVCVLQTGSEEVVSREYYERYKNDGLVYRGDYKEVAPKKSVVKNKED